MKHKGNDPFPASTHRLLKINRVWVMDFWRIAMVTEGDYRSEAGRDDTSGVDKRTRTGSDEALPAAKRQRLQSPALTQLGIDANVTPMTLHTGMPSELFYLIASSLSLHDYFSLVRIDSGTWRKCKAAPEWVGTFLTDTHRIKRCPEMLCALTKIESMPPTWYGSLLCFFARETRTIDVRDRRSMDSMWAKLRNIKPDRLPRCHESNEAAQLGSDRLKCVTYLAEAERSLNDPLFIKSFNMQLPRLPMAYWPAILELKPGLLSDDDPHVMGLAASYAGSAHHFSAALAEKIMNALFLLADKSNISADLLHRFHVPEAFQRSHLDPRLAERIGSDSRLTYPALVQNCLRWRPGDALFQRMVEDGLIKRHAAILLLDRHVDDLEAPPALADPSMRVLIRQFITAAEQVTISELKGEPKHIDDFLDRCERISLFSVTDPLPILLDIAAQAPWQMQPALLHRFSTLLARQHARSNTLDAVGVTHFKTALGNFRRHLPCIIRTICDGKSTGLTIRWTAMILLNNVIFYKSQIGLSAEGIDLYLKKVDGAIPSNELLPILKVLVSLPRRFYGGGDSAFVEKVISDDTIRRYVNDFLRNPKSRCNEIDPTLFQVVKQQIPKIWHLLPEDPGPASQRRAILAKRLGLTTIQEEELRKAILNNHVKLIANGERIVGVFVQPLDAVDSADEEDNRYVDDQLWETVFRPRLKVLGRAFHATAGWERISPYLREKISIFLEPSVGHLPAVVSHG